MVGMRYRMTISAVHGRCPLNASTANDAQTPFSQRHNGRPIEPASYEHFVRLFAEHHRRIFAYIQSLLPNRSYADDVFQETSVILWREFPNFRKDGDFVRWACAIAFNQVRKLRRQLRSDRHIFSDGLLEKIAQEHQPSATDRDDRYEALAHCLKKLRDIDCLLIQRCYSGSSTFKEVAAELGRPVNTVYKAINRIRRSLFDCIDSRLQSAS